MKRLYVKYRNTPDSIVNLRDGEIFVFGSNLDGNHTGGAAYIAITKFGAIYGRGYGLQGSSYAIPTMHGGIEDIRPYVEDFIFFARNHKEFTFLVTRIGCGIAGFKDEDIAPLFINAIAEENIVLPESFENIIASIRPLPLNTINYFLNRLKEKNPYCPGSLSYGMWEQREYFELLWASFTYLEWCNFFKEHSIDVEFERNFKSISEFKNNAVNKEIVFNLYWYTIFSPQRMILLDQCHYYKGEVISPFYGERGLFWDYEKCWVGDNINLKLFIAEYLKYYKDEGLEDLSPNDGVSMSMKAILLNRYLHWGGGIESIDHFRKWYISKDYTNIYAGINKKQLYNDSPKEYLFFWGHHKKEGRVTKSCLSQWYMCNFTVDGVNYSSAEQYMMAEKAKLMGDEKTRIKILKTSDPKEIKDLGKSVKNFDECLWHENKSKIVVKGNYHKFMDNSDLRDFLLSTGRKILVEASPYDIIWGVGMKEDDPNITNPYAWKGENLLGFALMQVREMIRKR